MKRSYFIGSGIIIAITFAGGLYVNANFFEPDTTVKKEEDTSPEQPVSTTILYQSYDLPEKADFAGEVVPLEDFEVRERFDAELTGTIFRHSSTWVGFKRANRFFPVIAPILQNNGLPADFKYLAVIESNLANVVSPSKAAGFWQFLDKTAIKYGLEVNEEVDERYHLEKATEAACKYLKEAYVKFGNWTSAAASYNMGMAGLSGDMLEQVDSNYYNLRLNSETSRYILRLVTTKVIFEDPSAYGYKIEKNDLYPEIPVNTIEISTPIPDLVAFAKNNGTNYKLLRELNPWLRKTYLTNKTGKTYQIKVPAHGWNNYLKLQEGMGNIFER